MSRITSIFLSRPLLFEKKSPVPCPLFLSTIKSYLLGCHYLLGTSKALITLNFCIKNTGQQCLSQSCHFCGETAACIKLPLFPLLTSCRFFHSTFTFFLPPSVFIKRVAFIFCFGRCVFPWTLLCWPFCTAFTSNSTEVENLLGTRPETSKPCPTPWHCPAHHTGLVTLGSKEKRSGIACRCNFVR